MALRRVAQSPRQCPAAADPTLPSRFPGSRAVSRFRLAALRAAASAAALLPPPRRGRSPDQSASAEPDHASHRSARTSERILLLRPDHLGDLLLATAVLRALRLQRPAAEIVALVGPWSAPALEGNPDVDRVLTYPFPWFDRRPLPPPAERFAAAGALAAHLRGLAPDEAIILRPDHWWGALVAALAGIRRRTGYAYPECSPFLTHSFPPPPHEHVVLSGLRLVGANLTQARPGTPATRFQATRLQRSTTKPYAVIHPGANSPVKRWPPDRWAAVADVLAARGLDVLLAAGPGEESETRAITAASQQRHTIAPQARCLSHLAALLANADLALGNDSAPMHLATAVDTPTIRLVGPADETLFGPWGDPARHRVIRAPGTRPDPNWLHATGRPHPTLLAITVEQVLAALP